MSIELVIPSNHLILCHPLLLLPSIFPSIRVFSNESVLHIRWPKYWSFNFSISPSNEYSGLISFRIDWFDLLAVQGTLTTPTPQFKQEYWSGLPGPPPGDLPNPGIKPRSSALQVDSLPSEPPGKPPGFLFAQSSPLCPFLPKVLSPLLPRECPGSPSSSYPSRSSPSSPDLCVIIPKPNLLS